MAALAIGHILHRRLAAGSRLIQTDSSVVTHQKCTVFTPTGLFHMRWKVLCCSGAAPASELWKRQPWPPGRRNGAEALRNAKRALLKKRKPTRDDMAVEGRVMWLREGRWGGRAEASGDRGVSCEFSEVNTTAQHHAQVVEGVQDMISIMDI